MREGGRTGSLGEEEEDTGEREIEDIREETEAGVGGMEREKVGEDQEDTEMEVITTTTRMVIITIRATITGV